MISGMVSYSFLPVQLRLFLTTSITHRISLLGKMSRGIKSNFSAIQSQDVGVDRHVGRVAEGGYSSTRGQNSPPKLIDGTEKQTECLFDPANEDDFPSLLASVKMSSKNKRRTKIELGTQFEQKSEQGVEQSCSPQLNTSLKSNSASQPDEPPFASGFQTKHLPSHSDRPHLPRISPEQGEGLKNSRDTKFKPNDICLAESSNQVFLKPSLPTSSIQPNESSFPSGFQKKHWPSRSDRPHLHRKQGEGLKISRDTKFKPTDICLAESGNQVFLKPSLPTSSIQPNESSFPSGFQEKHWPSRSDRPHLHRKQGEGLKISRDTKFKPTDICLAESSNQVFLKPSLPTSSIQPNESSFPSGFQKKHWPSRSDRPHLHRKQGEGLKISRDTKFKPTDICLAESGNQVFLKPSLPTSSIQPNESSFPSGFQEKHWPSRSDRPHLHRKQGEGLKISRDTKFKPTDICLAESSNQVFLKPSLPTSSIQPNESSFPSGFQEKHWPSRSDRPHLHRKQGEGLKISRDTKFKPTDICLAESSNQVFLKPSLPTSSSQPNESSFPSGFQKKHLPSRSERPHLRISPEQGVGLQNSRDTKCKPFDLCLSDGSKQVFLKPSLLIKEQRIQMDSSVKENGEVLRPGMVLLKSYIPVGQQVEIILRCQELGLGTGSFYQPGYKDGAKLRLHMMCLGLDWDPQTRKYGRRRQHDNSKPPDIPLDFSMLVKRVLHDSHTLIKQQSGRSDVEEILPLVSPDICIVNFYTTNGRLGLHQDRDESRDSLLRGLPVVSFSIGDSAEFLYGDQRDIDKAESVLLESGDVLIFGGKSRHIFHGVASIIPKTAPRALSEHAKLRPGRLNLTFRQH